MLVFFCMSVCLCVLSGRVENFLLIFTVILTLVKYAPSIAESRYVDQSVEKEKQYIDLFLWLAFSRILVPEFPVSVGNPERAAACDRLAGVRAEHAGRVCQEPGTGTGGK